MVWAAVIVAPRHPFICCLTYQYPKQKTPASAGVFCCCLRCLYALLLCVAGDILPVLLAAMKVPVMSTPLIYQTSKPMQPRRKHDRYLSPPSFPTAALRAILPPDFYPERVLDPAYGTGAWGRGAWNLYPSAYFVGVDIDPNNPGSRVYDETHCMDFRRFRPNVKPEAFDLVCTNPPFGDLAEPYVHEALRLTRPGGFVVYLLLQSFLASASRYETMYGPSGAARPVRVFTSSQRLSFDGYGSGTDMREYSVYCWQKDNYPETYQGGWFLYR